MKKIKTLCIIAILFANYSSAQKLNCDKPNKVQSVNQKVREKTYQYIKLVNKKEYNVNKDSILALAKTYIDLQTSFNALFKQMQIDKLNLASKGLICKRYSQELNDLIDNANLFNDRIFKLVSPNTKVSNFGTKEVLDIIDWLWKKFKEGPDKFLKEVAWNDWDTLTSGTEKKETKEDKPKNN